jgi:hypothetical protein
MTTAVTAATKPQLARLRRLTLTAMYLSPSVAGR